MGDVLTSHGHERRGGKRKHVQDGRDAARQAFGRHLADALGDELAHHDREVREKEPPCTEPYARWCGRTVNKNNYLPPTRLPLQPPTVTNTPGSCTTSHSDSAVSRPILSIVGSEYRVMDYVYKT